MLAKDLKSYQDSIDAFGVPALHERFEFVRQLGQIFLVRPEILKSYITEGYLGRIDPSLLRPYLAQRADWGSFEKGFDGAGAQAEGDAGPGKDKNGLRGRLGMGRLSVMMKDIEGLRELKLGDMPSVDMPKFASSLSFSTKAFKRSSGDGGPAIVAPQ